MSIALRIIDEQKGLVNDVAQPFTFPGGEIHLKKIKDLTGTWIADVRGAQADDLVTAAMLADVAQDRCNPFVLMIPYLPAARADRGTPAGAWVYSNIINQMFADQVIGIDPHSATISVYINNITALEPLPLIQRAINTRNITYDAVIAPDHGALTRSKVVADALGVDLYHAEKHRDFETGKILSIEMTEQLPPSGRYLVVDDICDGGGTFIGLAEATGLPLLGKRLDLWVTHGIFSGKAKDLRLYYNNIYTTDSHPGHSRLGVASTIVPTLSYMLQNLRKF